MYKNSDSNNTTRVIHEFSALTEVLTVIGCLFFLPLVSLVAYRLSTDQFTWGSTLLQGLGCFVLVAGSIVLSPITERLSMVLVPRKALRVLVDVAVWALIFACFFSFWTPGAPALILATISMVVWGAFSFLTMRRYEILLDKR